MYSTTNETQYNYPIAMNNKHEQQESSISPPLEELNSSFSSTRGIKSSRIIVNRRTLNRRSRNGNPKLTNCSLEKNIPDEFQPVRRTNKKHRTADTASSFGARRLFAESPIFSKLSRKTIHDEFQFEDLSDPETSSDPSIVENSVPLILPKRRPAGHSEDLSFCSEKEGGEEEKGIDDEEDNEEFSLDKVVKKLEALAEEGMTYQQFRGVFIPKKKKPTFTQYCYLRIFEKELVEM